MSQQNGGLVSALKGVLSGKKRISGGLVSLSSAVILAVYAVGYDQTKSAADQFAAQSEERRITDPAAVMAALPVALPASIGSGIAVGAPTPAAAINERQIAAIPAPAPAFVAPVTGPAAAAPVAGPPTVETTTQPTITAEPAAAPAEPRTPEAAPVVTPAVPVAQHSEYKDGSYFGWGTSRHGNIEANVIIQDGRIASAAISQCRTRYPCSWISHLPGQVLERQSPNVDYVSGATQSVNAYYYAVVEAISKAK